jgi:hypothetical protein
VANLDDAHEMLPVVDLVDQPVLPDPQSQESILCLNRLGPRGSRIPSQILDALDNLPLVSLREPSQISNSTWGE